MIIVLLSIVTLLVVMVFNFKLRLRRRRKVKIPTIIASSPEVAFEIMKTHDLAFCSKPTNVVLMKFFYNGLDISFSKYGEHSNMKRVASFRSVREGEVHVFIQSIRCSCMFSDDGQCNRTKLHDLVIETVELMGGFSIGDFFPSLGWLSVITGFKGKLEMNFKRMDEFFEREIEEHYLSLMTVQGHDDQEDDFLDVLLKLQKDSTNLGFSLTRDHIKAILMDISLARTDTSVATIEYAMKELMRYSLIMKKRQDVVRGVIRNKGKVEECDLQQLQYLKLVINETLRLHCIVPLLLPRERTKECNVLGYDISKNTMVLVNAWAIARDPKFWENPKVLMLERFQGSAINYKDQHFEFILFCADRRICPGMQLGVIAVEIALANILYHFNWELLIEMCYKEIDMANTFGLVLIKICHYSFKQDRQIF
ncbi:Costunolide synthase protein [Dioscorea alata]|uniref:Costunolide synthase protein n=1 Tax=Dioscorea alata TaxID=55571 RepID=A0ACB7TY76_DIOAL|nr:Costunolide synthase protein [Dioscorea alata]